MKLVSMIDWLSLKLTIGTITGGLLLAITKMPFFGWLTAIAAISTIVYNGIKIYKALTKK